MVQHESSLPGKKVVQYNKHIPRIHARQYYRTIASQGLKARALNIHGNPPPLIHL
jgi:hypothetical protein